MTNLSQMTLAQLADLHNQHAEKPVKRFSSKSDAVRRTAAVLPKVAKRLANRRQGKTAALLGNFKATVGTAPFAVDATAKRLGVSPKEVRSAIDLLRRQEGKSAVAALGKGVFQVAR